MNSAFSGQGNYTVNLSVTMRGDVNGSRLCGLLNIDNRFCSEYGQPLAIGYQSVYPTTYSDAQLSFPEDAPVAPASNTSDTVSVAKMEVAPIVETSLKKSEPLPEKKTTVEFTVRI